MVLDKLKAEAALLHALLCTMHVRCALGHAPRPDSAMSRQAMIIHLAIPSFVTLFSCRPGACMFWFAVLVGTRGQLDSTRPVQPTPLGGCNMIA